MSFLYTVCYGDTDAGGVVYFANYLRLCEHSWFRFLKTRGWDLSKEEKDGGPYLTVKKVEAEYVSPARYGVTVEVVTSVSDMERASFWFQHLLRDAQSQTLFARIRNQMVAVDASGRLRRLPENLRQILATAFKDEIS